MYCKTIPVGGVLFVIEHRKEDNEDEQGASLSLLAETKTNEQTITRLVTVWRADCVMKDPHEHWLRVDDESTTYHQWFTRSPHFIEGVTKQEPATFDGSVEPFMEHILHVADIIKKAGYEASSEIDQVAINAASGSIQRWMTLAQSREAFMEALQKQ